MKCKYIHCPYKGSAVCLPCAQRIPPLYIETHAEASARICREALEEEGQ